MKQNRTIHINFLKTHPIPLIKQRLSQSGGLIIYMKCYNVMENSEDPTGQNLDQSEFVLNGCPVISVLIFE